jgi:hypothetical protein
MISIGVIPSWAYASNTIRLACPRLFPGMVRYMSEPDAIGTPTFNAR